MIRNILNFSILGVLGILILAQPVHAQVPSYNDVLLVINDSSPISQQIGNYFIFQRPIPSPNVCHIQAPTTEPISQAQFNTLKADIKNCLVNNHMEDTINYIVTTKGVPFTFNSAIGTIILNGAKISPVRSVDSFLTTLWWKEVPAHIMPSSANLYRRAIMEFKHSDPRMKGIYLVTRLTGYDYEDVKKLIDQATLSFNPAMLRNGETILLDHSDYYFQSDPFSMVNAWGGPISFKQGSASEFLTDQSNITMAWNWGSNDTYASDSNTWNFNFLPGAIMDTGVSTSGRTFDVEQFGGLQRSQNSVWASFLPLTKDGVKKKNLNRLAKIGNILYCGTGGYKNFNKYNRKKKAHGIFVFDLINNSWLPTNYTKASTSGGLVGDYIFDLTFDAVSNVLWVGTENGLSSFNVTTNQWQARQAGYEVRSIIVRGAEVWMATNAGLKIYNITTSQVTTYDKSNSGIASNDLYDLVYYPNADTTWMVALSGELISFKGTTWTTSRMGADLVSLFLDGTNLWIGTRNNGILRRDMVANTYKAFRDWEDDDAGYSFAVQGNDLLVGTFSQGVIRFDRTGTIPPVTYKKDGAGRGAVNDILVDGQTIWLASSNYRQTLVADLVTSGVTGTHGFVNEPCGELDAALLYERYMAGYNLAEAFYGTGMALNWMSVVVGDPKVQINKGARMPNINFAFLETSFLYNKEESSPNYTLLDDNTTISPPASINGRVSLASGTGSWKAFVKNGSNEEVSFASGSIPNDKTISIPFSQISNAALKALRDTVPLSLAVYNSSGTKIAEKVIEFYTPGTEIISPFESTPIPQNGKIELYGSVRTDFQVEYILAPEYESKNNHFGEDVRWSKVGVTLNNSYPVEDGLIASIDLNQALAQATAQSVGYKTAKTLLLRILAGSSLKIVQIQLNDMALSGWPQELEFKGRITSLQNLEIVNLHGNEKGIVYSGKNDTALLDNKGTLNEQIKTVGDKLYPSYVSRLAVGNIDDNLNDTEVVIFDPYTIYAYKQDGSPVPGFHYPTYVRDIYSPNHRYLGGIFDLVDVDNDGKSEILISSGKGKEEFLELANSLGQKINERVWNDLPFAFDFSRFVDVDNDGRDEALLFNPVSSHKYKLHILDLPGLTDKYPPILIPAVIFSQYQPPIFYDFDGDGIKEYVLGNSIYSLSSGSVYNGWQPPVPANIFNIADIDNDGTLEILAGYCDQIIITDKSGHVRTGWEEKRLYWEKVDDLIKSGSCQGFIKAIQVGDIDGNGIQEIVVIGIVDNEFLDRNIYEVLKDENQFVDVWEPDGSKWRSDKFPMFIKNNKNFILEDMNQDGIKDIILDESFEYAKLGAVKNIVWVLSSNPEYQYIYPSFQPIPDKSGTELALVAFNVTIQNPVNKMTFQSTNMPNGAKFYPLGDVDMSGIVTSNDGTLIQQYVVGSITLSEIQKGLGDTNEDGLVNTIDVNKIQKIVSGEKPLDKYRFVWTPGTGQAGEYHVNIKILNSQGQGDQEIVKITVNQSPVIPTNFKAVATSPTQVNLSWSYSGNAASVASFSIERSTSAAGTFTLVGITGFPATSYSNTGLSSGATYYYRIRATNASGVYSGYSSVISVTTFPVTPTNFKAVAKSPTQVDLSWSSAGNAASSTYYFIERSTSATGAFTLVGITGFPATSYSNTGLSSGATYYYRIRATNASGVYSGYSSVISVTTFPAVPANFKAVATSPTQVTLSWSSVGNATSSTYYFIERSTSATGAFTVVGSLGSTATSYSNTGLTKGTAYYYRIRAINASWVYSGYSSVISVTTPLS